MKFHQIAIAAAFVIGAMPASAQSFAAGQTTAFGAETSPFAWDAPAVAAYDAPLGARDRGIVTDFTDSFNYSGFVKDVPIILVPQEAAAVPEPATWAMMIVGFGLVGGAMRRRAKTTVNCPA